MIKLGFNYQDEYEKFSAEHNINSEYVDIETCIEKFCRFLIGVGFSEDAIQRHIGFDGCDVYTMEDWINRDK